MNHVKYQPEIDGLRAIAVLSVILFHLNEKWLPGGFVGVDVFFVISGYLITSNIYSQIQNNTFLFFSFYNKRIKRLLPSLYIVLLFCTLLSSLIFLHDDYFLFVKSLKHIVLFWGNHFFASGSDYFSPLSNETPLLHTWSLAIEEQFYFAWPIALYVLVKLNFSKKNIVIISILFCILSFFISHGLLLYGFKLWSYYSFPSRYGELLIGGIFSIWNKKISSKSTLYATTGLFFIVLSMFFFDEQSAFPGFLSLLPSIGTLLILISNKNLITQFLSLKPLPYIGKISYQLYLWHWPFLAFVRYSTGQYNLSLFHIILVIILTSIFSVFTYYFIENKIRYLEISFAKSFSYFYLLPTLTVISVAIFMQNYTYKSVVFDQETYSTYGKNICHGQVNIDNCQKGNNSQPKMFFFGDSHAAHLNNFLDLVGKNQQWSSFVISSSGCFPRFDFEVNNIQDLESRKECKSIQAYINNNYLNYQYIGIAARWDLHLKDSKFIQAFDGELKFLASKNKKVFIFSQVPIRTISPQREELLKTRLNQITAHKSDNISIQANFIIKSIAKKYDNVVWIDISSTMINLEKNNSNQNLPLYKDKDHLNIYGSASLAQKMIELNLLDNFKILGK